GTVAKELLLLFCDIGFPKIIQSDNGKEFTNSLMTIIQTELKITHNLTTPYHPSGNGAAERYVQTFKSIVQRSLNGRIMDWDIHLPMTQLQMNTRTASLHNSTPFSLFFGRPFGGIEDHSKVMSKLLTPEQLNERMKYLTELVFPAVSEKSKGTQKRMIEKFNARRRIVDFQEGAYVMVRDQGAQGTLVPKYEGPFKVVRRTSRGAYVLRDLNGQLLARNYAPDQMKLVTRSAVEEDEL